MSPSAGYHWIWSQICYRIELEGDLRIFIGLASEWDDHPRSQPALEAQIVAAARTLVAQREPRRWVRVQARQGMSPLATPITLEELPVETLRVSGDLMKSFVSWASNYEDTFVLGAEGLRVNRMRTPSSLGVKLWSNVSRSNLGSHGTSSITRSRGDLPVFGLDPEGFGDRHLCRETDPMRGRFGQ